MSLKQELPQPVSDFLQSQSVSLSDIRIATATDIDLLGSYTHQWLIVTSTQVITASNGDDPKILMQIPLTDASEYRCHATVGSGLLQARINGCYIDLLRYSNRLDDRFSKIARKLNAAIYGEPIQIFPEDEVDNRRCRQCGLVLNVGDTCPRCVNKGAVLGRMWKLIKPYQWSAAVVMALLAVGIALDLVGPQLTRFLVDNVLPGSREAAREIQSQPFQVTRHLQLLSAIVGVLVVVQILRMGVGIVNGWIGSTIGTAITADMRNRLFEHLQKLSVSYYDRQQVGSLVGRIAYDTESLHGFVNQITGGFLLQLIMLVGVSIMMLTISVKLALFTLIPIPGVIAGSFVFWRYIYPIYYRWWDASSKQSGMLSGILSGIRVVKAFNQEGRECSRFEKASTNLKKTRRRVDYALNVFNPIMGIVFQLGGWIVWYVGGRDVLSGRMTLGELMAFFGYLAMFYGPLGTLTQFTNWLTQFVTQAHRIFEILDSPLEISEAKDPVDPGTIRGDVLFDKVHFGYNRHEPILNDVELNIKAGEMIGLVGRSGSGKTTLVNLLCRFYDVQEGAVKIDGIDVREMDMGQLRKQIGIVLQEPFLFRGSILENITYGRPEEHFDKVVAASRAANCHDFIMRHTYGYDTWVGERGAGLSGGERQRISIARVLLTDPRILILDEATSSVDAESEAAIQTALAAVVKGRTTIAIAHRLSTLRMAQRIVVVDGGRIAEQGTHQQLIEQDGIYSHLVRIQGQRDRLSLEETLDRGLQEPETPQPQPEHSGGPLPPIDGHEPRWLTPENALVHLGNLGVLHVTVPDEAIYGGIFAVRCMPVHFPRKYISLRYYDPNGRETEIGLIRDLDQWPQNARKLIEESIGKRYFVHTITAVNTIEVLNGYLKFDVDTDLGPMQFMIRWQADRAHNYGKQGKMLIDTDENRYLVPDVEALPENQKRLFMRHIYW